MNNIKAKLSGKKEIARSLMRIAHEIIEKNDNDRISKALSMEVKSIREKSHHRIGRPIYCSRYDQAFFFLRAM